MDVKIFRFKFSPEVVEKLFEFSKKHQEKDRKAYKEEWNQWTKNPEIENLFKKEKERLETAGYQGNVDENLFKSARYYFRKKKEEPSQKKEKRQEYSAFSTNFLQEIDEHIKEQFYKDLMKSEKQKEITVSPAKAYLHFCKEKHSFIIAEILSMKQFYLQNPEKRKTPEQLEEKFKKTYKNRFYQMRIQQKK